MKNILSLFFGLFSLIGWAATDTITVNTEIQSVTVFLKGAQVTRTGTLSLKSGRHVLALKSLPFELNPQSIQVGPISNCNVLLVKQMTSAGNDLKKDKTVLALEERIKSYGIRRVDCENRIQAFDMELGLLRTNQDLASQSNGTTVTEIRAAADFYRQRMNEILQQKSVLSQKITDLRDSISDLNAKVNELTYKNRKSISTILVLVDCEKETTAGLEVSYYVPSAGWMPFYDFRVEDVGKPFVIDYNANVFQSSGEDWKQVKLKLSNGNPLLSGSKPDLSTWFLGRSRPPVTTPAPGDPAGTGALKGRVTDGQTGEPIPFSNIIIEQNGIQIGGTTSDFDGNYMIKPVPPGVVNLKATYVGYHDFNLNGIITFANKITFQNITLQQSKKALSEVEVLSYKVPLISKDQTVSGGTITRDEVYRMAGRSGDGAASSVGGINRGSSSIATSVQTINVPITIDLLSNSLNSSVINLEYAIDVPFSIQSDGEDYFLKIKEVTIPVSYMYFAVPKLEPDAFLVAELPDWQGLNLLPGKANIFYQGTYTGESSLDVQNFNDTLFFSLGRDKNILIERKVLKEKYEKRSLGNTIRESIGFEIVVKNTEPIPVQITLEDQIPVSVKSTIEIELTESSEAAYDPLTGKLTWKLNLQPNEQKNLTFGFSVKYPASEKIIIN